MNELSKDQIGQYYTATMDAIKIRLRSANEMFSAVYGGNKKAKSDDFPKIEFCYLQFRMIAEHIALAALFAQNQHPDARKKDIVRSYKADEIFARLSRINPECFPKALIKNDYMDYTDKPDTGLSAEKLKEIYVECSNYLHAGSVKSLLKWRLMMKPDKLIEWSRIIKNHLQHHCIEMSQGEKLIVCMESPEHNNDVHAFFLIPVKH